MDLRCATKKHAVVVEPGSGLIEISCNSRFCGSGPGKTVLHRFDVGTGELVGTRQFKDPGRKVHAHTGSSSAVRSA